MKKLMEICAALAPLQALWCSSPGMATNSWPGCRSCGPLLPWRLLLR